MSVPAPAVQLPLAVSLALVSLGGGGDAAQDAVHPQRLVHPDVGEGVEGGGDGQLEAVRHQLVRRHGAMQRDCLVDHLAKG